MTSIVPLGRLEPVSLRDAWPNEASNFTPWLAEEDNLLQLGDTIGLQLELESVEKQVGSFSADILAKDVSTKQWVLIENQIAPTDHSHLGQLLTYAAGLDARTVIWIAESFRDEHRAAIDFLNRATVDEFAFFAIQIELWRIGDSSFAPRFSVVAKPNEWSKQGQAAKQAAEGELSDTQQMYREFWLSVIEKAKDRYPALAARPPYKGNWQVAERLRGGDPSFSSNAAFTWDKGLRCEIYVDGTLAKTAFRSLKSKKSEIENLLGSTLSWEELPEAKASRIALYKPGLDRCTDRTKWADLQEWLLIWWPRLADVFRPIAKGVDVSELVGSEHATD
ncbi:MAG: DUF4268 domain-containing protein [Rhodoblastus sp.]|nr:DUF4268 domain-containing protein [Rhodoblastus sp.]